MTIEWFPGHMTKARRLLAEAIPKNDVVIDVIDARMPLSSANPVVTELRGAKSCVKVLAKSDLADPAVTKAWIKWFEAHPGAGKVVAITSSTKDAAAMRTRIPAACESVATKRSGPGKKVKAIIVGIPNVGKSTLTNTLIGRKVAKVGDEPAVTKAKQQVILESGMVLSDNPGILWPKQDDQDVAYRLALGGAFPDTVMDYETIARFGAELFLRRYSALLVARYKLDHVPADATALLEEIGRKRGCMKSGGIIDVHKAADILVHEFRSGTLGRISLEEPPGAGS